MTGQPENNDLNIVVGFPIPVYTSILIGCCVAVSGAQYYSGINNSVAAAGFFKPAFAAGEYWRIFTGFALHGGLLHLAMNSYAFYSFGKLVEVLSNKAHLAIVFILAALGGNALSLIFMPEGLSVGASGGILGVVSFLAVYAFKRRKFVSAEFRKSLLTNIGFILIFGLVLYQVIDNYGHIGGLLVGAVYGLIEIPSDEYKDPREANRFTSIVGLAAVLFFITISAFSIYKIITAPQIF